LYGLEVTPESFTLNPKRFETQEDGVDSCCSYWCDEDDGEGPDSLQSLAALLLRTQYVESSFTSSNGASSFRTHFGVEVYQDFSKEENEVQGKH
jgi:hypothetical protein